MTLIGTVTSARSPKVPGTSYGRIENSEFRNCSSPVRVLTLPWRVIYNGILGTLPEAVSAVDLAIEGVNFLFEVGPLSCLYGGTIRGLVAVTGRNPYVSTLYAIPTNTVPLVRGIFLCPPTGRFTGTFGLSPTQTITVF